MIVRDEAFFLADCLKSVQGEVDEIIIVDTGSRDDSIKIAREHGAKVFQIPWKDDFSQARNHALDHATGNWILILDADERLLPNAGEQIRRAINTNPFDYGKLPLYDALTLEATPQMLNTQPNLFKLPVYLHRLFKNNGELRWENRIHEYMTVLNNPQKIGITLEIPIVHYGNIASIREKLNKYQRNLKIIELVCREQPDDLIYQSMLLIEKAKSEPYQDFCSQIDAFWERLRTNFLQKDPVRHPRFTNVASHRMKQKIESRQFDEALKTYFQCRDWGIQHPHCDFFAAFSYECLAERSTSRADRAKNIQKARELYSIVLKANQNNNSVEVSQGITSWNSLLHLGRLALLEHDYEKAIQFISQSEKALEKELEQPKTVWHQIQISLAECLIGQADYRSALRKLKQVTLTNSPDVECLRADAYEHMGNLKAAIRAIKKLMNGMAPPKFMFTSVKLRWEELLITINLLKYQPCPGTGMMGLWSTIFYEQSVKQFEDPIFIDEDRLKRVIHYYGNDKGWEVFFPFFREEIIKRFPNLCQAVQRVIAEHNKKSSGNSSRKNIDPHETP